MRRSRAGFPLRVTILGVLFLAVIFGALVRSVLLSFNYTCEVCLAFHGHTVCREAVGRDRDAAIGEATRCACAYLTAQKQDLAACLAKPPDTVSCSED